MAAQARLDLLIPGLFGPVPLRPGDLPPTPVLDRMLARSDRVPALGADPVDALLGRFGVQTPVGRDAPSAPFALLGDDAEAPMGGWWLHADPVHLRPDRDQLRLFDARHLAVDRQEADALVDLFNAHFAGDGLRLAAPDPARWYLHTETPPEICTRPLHAVVGRSVDPLLPTGPGARAWARLLNEAQMLFHGAEVNLRREAEGRPVINGLWTWGGGQLPQEPIETPYAEVRAADPLGRGLARAAGARLRPPPGANDACPLPEAGPLLLVLDGLWASLLDADPAGWLVGLAEIEACAVEWTAALLEGRLAQLSLDPGTGDRFDLTRARLRRFWRRGVPLSGRLLAASGG
jgi:hypothetical protein